jgi:hypothetical protein
VLRWQVPQTMVGTMSKISIRYVNQMAI